MKRIFSLLFWSFLVVSSVVMFTFNLGVLAVTFPFDRNRKIVHMVSCFWGSLYIYVNPLWHVRVTGREHLPWRGPAVIVANHQSLGDIVVLYMLYRPFKWVAKAELSAIPVLGWNMSINQYVKLRRGDRRSIVQMMKDCTFWLEHGMPVLIFPEGTRSEDGNLKKFSSGAFKLAVRCGCPVIPVALDGTADTLPKGGFVLREPANVTIRVLAPINPADFDNAADRLQKHVHALITDELKRIRSGAPACTTA